MLHRLSVTEAFLTAAILVVPWLSVVEECGITFSLSVSSPETRRNGLAVVLDATRSSWRTARACMRQVGVTMGADAAALIVLRPEAFWDKQRVDNCTRTQKEGEVRGDSTYRVTVLTYGCNGRMLGLVELNNEGLRNLYSVYAIE